MSDDVDLQQEILQRTLQEVAHDQSNDEVANPCVICLEPVSETAIAVPCRHANFDFLCLLSWLEQRRSCPLCKSDITSVKYDLDGPDGPKIYQLPALPSPSENVPSSATSDRHPGSGSRRGLPRRRRPEPPRDRPSPDDALLRREEVYRRQLYSLRVGSNRLSQYQELTPERFNREEELVSRARKWIRRELRVFAFLNPGTATDAGRVPRAGQQRLDNRRGNNAEFLLEYTIAILRTVDIKGSAGQAEELLRDFIGRGNARLFLHELQAWLRSPYTSLEDWDRHVQYEDTPSGNATTSASRESTATPVYRGDGRPSRGRVSKPPYRRRPYRGGRSGDAAAQTRRLQYARDRYVPD
ncbi:RING finger domain protein [Aspergillus floccosus]